VLTAQTSFCRANFLRILIFYLLCHHLVTRKEELKSNKYAIRRERNFTFESPFLLEFVSLFYVCRNCLFPEFMEDWRIPGCRLNKYLYIRHLGNTPFIYEFFDQDKVTCNLKILSNITFTISNIT
jgi:hypothetical protein